MPNPSHIAVIPVDAVVGGLARVAWQPVGSGVRQMGVAVGVATGTGVSVAVGGDVDVGIDVGGGGAVGTWVGGGGEVAVGVQVAVAAKGGR